MIQIISNYDEELKPSKVESAVISQADFQKYLKQVQFLEENPANKFIFDK